MRVLHTSDWHLGRSLYGRKRYAEFEAFLDWLAETVTARQVDVLLVAGDVFDTGTPGNRAQALYYRFLVAMSRSCCRHVVIVAGNHDSPSFLNAPKSLLHLLNVHVVGSATENLADEVLVLENNGRAQVIVCAVPYLRDQDLRTQEAGESIDEKNARLGNGLKQHYAEVCALAESRRLLLADEGQADVPVIAMGHLFAAGGQTLEGDGVRELYVGSLMQMGREVFPNNVDYVALGHLHVPQTVGGATHIRYSGSPIPMGFGEAKQQKEVVLIEFEGRTPRIEPLPVPRFQELVRLSGSLDELQTGIRKLVETDSQAWLELEYTGVEAAEQLRVVLVEMVAETGLEILRIKNKRLLEKAMQAASQDETLDDLTPQEVFNRCLDAFDVAAEERPPLQACYQSVLQSLQEHDARAE